MASLRFIIMNEGAKNRREEKCLCQLLNSVLISAQAHRHIYIHMRWLPVDSLASSHGYLRLCTINLSNPIE